VSEQLFMPRVLCVCRATIERLQAKVTSLTTAKNNHGDVVLRQKTIKGLWAEPSVAYKARMAEMRELEAKLRMFTI
jgi:hypothetical protein